MSKGGRKGEMDPLVVSGGLCAPISPTYLTEAKELYIPLADIFPTPIRVPRGLITFITVAPTEEEQVLAALARLGRGMA